MGVAGHTGDEADGEYDASRAPLPAPRSKTDWSGSGRLWLREVAVEALEAGDPTLVSEPAEELSWWRCDALRV